MNHQTTIATRRTGTRAVCNTTFPVENSVVRVALPGRRVHWDVIVGICNGTADHAITFDTRRAALAELESRGGEVA